MIVTHEEAEQRLLDFLTKKLRGRSRCSFNVSSISRRLKIHHSILTKILQKLQTEGRAQRDGKSWWTFYATPKDPEEINPFAFQTALQLTIEKGENN